MLDTGLIQKILAILSRFKQLKIAVLYGSFAKGTQKHTSDIDLGVAADNKLSVETLVEIQTALSNETSKEIDLIDLKSATGVVFKEALTTGKIILNKDSSLFAGILSRMLFEQADFEPLRNRVLEANRKKVLG